MYAFICACSVPLSATAFNGLTRMKGKMRIEIESKKICMTVASFCTRVAPFLPALSMHSLPFDFYLYYCANIIEVAFSGVFVAVTIAVWLSVLVQKEKKIKTNYKRKPKYSRFGAYIWWFWILSGWADINRNQWHSNIRFSNFLNGDLDIYHLKWSRAWHCKFLKGKRKSMVTFRSFLTVVSSMTG